MRDARYSIHVITLANRRGEVPSPNTDFIKDSRAVPPLLLGLGTDDLSGSIPILSVRNGLGTPTPTAGNL